MTNRPRKVLKSKETSKREHMKKNVYERSTTGRTGLKVVFRNASGLAVNYGIGVYCL